MIRNYDGNGDVIKPIVFRRSTRFVVELFEGEEVFSLPFRYHRQAVELIKRQDFSNQSEYFICEVWDEKE